MKMQKYIKMLATFLLLFGCTPVPEIPDLSKDTLKTLPYKHRKIIKVLADIHREICYQKVERKFKKDSLINSGTSFVVNPFTISQVKISRNIRVTIFIRNFSCAGENLWRATGTRKVFIIVKNNVFTAWVSEIPFVVREGKKYLLVLPQHQAMCSDLDEVCQSIATWDNLERSFITVRGPQTLTKYQLHE